MNRDRGARRIPAALATLVLGLAVAHVLLDDDALSVEVSEASILLVFAAVLAFVALRVGRERLDATRASRVAVTSLAAGLGVGGLATVFVAARIVAGEPITEAWFVLSIGWSLGSSAGGLVGYYVERVRAERAEQARLTGRLTVLQRVLRHNIRNEVGVIRGVASSAVETTDDPALESDLRTVVEHVDRVHELAEKAQTLTDLWNTDGAVETDLAAVTRDQVQRFRRQHPALDIDTAIPDRATAVAHPAAGVAVRETLDNAAVHNDDTVAVSVSVVSAGGWTTVEVVDDGTSVPKEEIDSIDALRESPLQHVTGLGLWVIYWVVDLSGGRLEIENREAGGVRVRMRFPSAESEPTLGPERADPSERERTSHDAPV